MPAGEPGFWSFGHQRFRESVGLMLQGHARRRAVVKDSAQAGGVQQSGGGGGGGVAVRRHQVRRWGLRLNVSGRSTHRRLFPTSCLWKMAGVAVRRHQMQDVRVCFRTSAAAAHTHALKKENAHAQLPAFGKPRFRTQGQTQLRSAACMRLGQCLPAPDWLACTW